LIPFGAYLAAERLHASGILAAVAAGITMSHIELSGLALATTRVQRTAVWDTAQFTLNGIMFVLLGEQLPGILRGAVASVEQSGHMNPWWLAVYAVTITLGLGLLRFFWVWGTLHLTLLRAAKDDVNVTRPHWRLVVATSLAGVRGAITLAGVMTLPLLMPDKTPFPARELAVFLATSVILLSLIIATIGLPRILKGLELPQEPVERQEEDNARQGAASAAMAAVEKAQFELQDQQSVDPDTYTNAAAHVIALYRYRLNGLSAAGKDDSELRRTGQAEHSLLLIGLKAEREEIFNLARQYRISDEISRKLVREIDLAETRYR
ncbi:MAG: cation:proton antiporter, partial [Herbaspirillum sp.]